MITASDDVEIFYLDDMEDEVVITEMTLRRQKLKLHVQFFLDEVDMLSALEARLAAEEALPQLIVTDLNMPGRGGIRLVEDLRSRPGYDAVTIGVCTGSENPADRAAALAAGGDFVVVKPFDRSKLSDICETTGRFRLIAGEGGQDHLRPITPTRPAA